MVVTDSIRVQFDQYELVIRQQAARIVELEAEVERLQSGLNAHQTLRLIYSDPNAPRSDRIKAAAASLPHETPKLMPERAPLELKAVEPELTLEEQCRVRLERENRMHALSLEERSALIAGVSAASVTANGNGSDGNGSDEH
jgi:hypothetical protein